MGEWPRWNRWPGPPTKRTSPTEPRVEPDPSDAKRMSFLDHLGELRSRLTRSLLALGLCFMLAWYKSVPIFQYFIRPLQPFLGGHKLVFIEITEPFLLYMKVS